MLKELKKEVCKMNIELKNNSLVMWTSGNVSARDPESNLIVIKPSGVHFDDLTPDLMVVTDIDGNILEGEYKPSVDLDSHLVVYRNHPEVNGVTHTHSAYATAFAIAGYPIDIYTTTSAAVFGGSIPISNLADVGEVAIGKEISRLYKETGCPAVLIRNHGVFTVGKNAETSLKNAVIAEETAQSVYYAMNMNPNLNKLDKEYTDNVYSFYTANYGQKKG